MRDQERLHRSTSRRRPSLGGRPAGTADAHDLPADQHQKQVVGLHHEQHRGGELRWWPRRRGSGWARVRVVGRASEVPGGVHLDAERDERDGHRHQAAESVDAQVERRGVRRDAGVDPAEERHRGDVRVAVPGLAGEPERGEQRHQRADPSRRRAGGRCARAGARRARRAPGRGPAPAPRRWGSQGITRRVDLTGGLAEGSRRAQVGGPAGAEQQQDDRQREPDLCRPPR